MKLKNTKNNYKSNIFAYAWQLVKVLGYSISKALKTAWRLYKKTNRLSINQIKEVVKQFKNDLKTKTLVVNGIEYNTLKDFGTAILELNNYDYINCITSKENNEPMCLSVAHSLKYSLQNERYNKVIITTGVWETPIKTVINYNNVNWSEFGTTA